MALRLGHKNIDSLFHETENKILLNNLSHFEDLELRDKLYTTYSDSISMIPQCECGEMKGGWLLGKVCPYCSTSVTKKFVQIKPLLWVKSYNNIQFFNPHFWGQLKVLFKSNGDKGMDAIRWLCDTEYRVQNVKPILRNLESIINGRGYSNFINSLPKIFTYLKNNSTFKANDKATKVAMLEELYFREKDVLFSDYLGLINKRLFVMEVTNKGKFTSSMLGDIINISLAAIKLTTVTDPRKVENGIAYIISSINELFETYMRTYIAGKKGNVRRHIYGTRVNFTARAVITALPLKYDYDTIHVPWTIGVVVMRPHLINKLSKLRMRYRDINEILYEATMRHIPIIEELLNELIAEAPGKGIPVIIHRNPSLLPGSSLFVHISKFKTDLEDKSVGISVLVVKAQNGDFDGDEENLGFALDVKMENMMKNFSPHYNIVDLDLFKINKNLYLPPTTMVTLSNYVVSTVNTKDNKSCPVYSKLLEKAHAHR